MKPLDPRLMKYAKSARIFIAISTALGLVTAALVILQSTAISSAVSPVINGNAVLADVMQYIVALCVIVLVRALVIGLRKKWGHRCADGAIRELRGAILTRAERLGPRWRGRHGADTVTLATRGLSDLEPYFVDYVPQLLLVMTVTPLTLATMLILDFWSALIAAIVIPLIPLFMILVGRFTEKASKRKLAVMERLASQLLDLMAGLPTLRALGREKSPLTHLRELGKHNTRATMSTLRVAFLSGAVLEFITTLSVALVAVEVGMRLVHGNITLFRGLLIIMLTPEVFAPLRQVGSQFHASANGVAAANAAFEILDTSAPTNEGITAPPIRDFDIALCNLSVASRGAWAPANLSAHITPGTLVALRGPSGSGKTTTAMILLGVEEATQGSIRLIPRILAKVDSTKASPPADEHTSSPTLPADRDNAHSLSDFTPESWWKQISWVPQIPTILPGTVWENIHAGASRKRVEEAARATGFAQVIESLPHGWDTVIGQGGVGLSVGQRQRLALTRALIEDSSLLILDEPTAHLDAMNEKQIISTLQQMRDKGRTILVIAHREALIAAADQVIDVPTRSATPREIQQWPVLGETEQLANLSFQIPNFLDPHAVKQEDEK